MRVTVGVREARGVTVALKSGVRVALGVGLSVGVCSKAKGVGLFWSWVILIACVEVGEADGRSATIIVKVGVADGVAVCPALAVSWTTVGIYSRGRGVGRGVSVTPEQPTPSTIRIRVERTKVILLIIQAEMMSKDRPLSK